MDALAFYTLLRSNPHLRLSYRQLRQGLRAAGADATEAQAARRNFAEKALTGENRFPFLGAVVTVTVDRPLGSRHPEHPELLYPVNYGYVEGVEGGDGEAQDAYILRVNEPVQSFTGRVVAIVQRRDDNENKWVVAPLDAVLYEPEIAHALYFQEQYFQSVYRCLYEKSCGAVLATQSAAGERLYLLIENESGHIGFPKGHVEFGETETGTALREIQEETGAKARFVPGFRVAYRYRLSGGVNKEAVYFLARYGGEQLTIQQSEISRHWVVPYEKACSLLNFEEDRRVLKKAHKVLDDVE